MKHFFKIYGRKFVKQLQSIAWTLGVVIRNQTMVRLADGTILRLRPVLPEESRSLLAMHDGLSPASLYLRYLRPYQPVLEDMERICRLQDKGGVALIAETTARPSAIVALAHAVFENDRLVPTAEPAIVVQDRFHGKGLGRMMFAALCRQARAKGIAVLHAHIHEDNPKMLQILKRMDHAVYQKRAFQMVEADIILNPDAGLGYLPGMGEALV